MRPVTEAPGPGPGLRLLGSTGARTCLRNVSPPPPGESTGDALRASHRGGWQKVSPLEGPWGDHPLQEATSSQAPRGGLQALSSPTPSAPIQSLREMATFLCPQPIPPRPAQATSTS